MPKKSELPIEKKTLNLFEGDAEAMADFYPSLGWSIAVRQLVHVHVKKLREKYSRSGAQVNARADIEALAASLDRDGTELAEVLDSIDDTGA